MSDLQRRPTGRLTPTTPGTPLAGGGDLTAGEWTGEVLTPAQMGVRWRVPDRDLVTDMAFQ